MNSKPMSLTRAALLTMVAAALSPTLSARPAAAGGAAETAARVQATYNVPMLEVGSVDPAVPHPQDILGHPVGARPATHAQIVAVFEALAAASARAELREHGETHEHRRLVHLVVSSESTMADLDSVRQGLRRLADPRGLSDSEERALVSDLPAVCWMGYSIHGDELSGADAAMLVAYHLAAGTDSLTRALSDRLIVVIDPLENPDGRDRFIQMTAQWAGGRPNPDVQSLQHAGFWPWGRTNHYLFDLNRDWFALVHPESRGRVREITAWQPQLMVDAHEMGSFDTFLFSPPREPFNPYMTASLRKWWQVFADGAAAAFDRHGWSYYTREWNEEWFPGYGSSWSCYLGAVGILYEQASVDGSLVKRPDETILSYPESVHHQYVMSMANIGSAADHRGELLADFVNEKRRASQAQGAFLFLEGDQPRRATRLAQVLATQGIEVQRATADFRAPRARSLRGEARGDETFPAGTYVVNLNQPMSPLARAVLDFDQRMSTEFLATELHELQKRKDTRLYEVTSWSMLSAYGLDAYESDATITAALEPAGLEGLGDGDPRGGRVVNAGARYGYLIDWRSDAAPAALARLLGDGWRVRAARKAFSVAGRDYVRGSLLVRRQENREGLDDAVREIAQATGVIAVGTATARAGDGPDLGGREFRRLREPRIAVAAGHPVSYGALGPLWFLLDHRLDMRVSLLDLARLGSYDLTKYNALVLPDLWGSPAEFERALGRGGTEKLREWIEAGGTLVGIGTGAAFAADSTRGLSQVRLRRDVLDRLDEFDAHLERELRALATPEVDSLLVWEGRAAATGPGAAAAPEATGDAGDEGDEGDEGESDGGGKEDPAARERADEYQRLLHPRGATLVAELDPEHWLTAGMGAWVPVNLYESRTYLSKDPVETPARLAAAGELRIGGLLWPEARERWARTAYATREGRGRGQIILFAGVPNLRAYWHGSERLLVNALLLGPGFGTSPPPPW